MAKDNVSVSGPIDVVTDSKQRVAFDLMKLIDAHSPVELERQKKDYWLTLYRQCYKAASGSSLESILREE